ncbi:hypothetical protein ULMS_12790 [Patiriisocius marinistellae]|uniref:HYR domain-containing protein n=1 Tax=Patiriisocius marinistellae TaxID=2494560 RepID=A0A5J4G186_9FLAO|nr:T9SS type A sorting domain-containing protein [Patiriisocius marinistellae]GEQ85771.1 hypothetical protein ULMS_12790 [Patiriisocius marinistellae]
MKHLSLFLLLNILFPFISVSQYVQLGDDIDGESFGDFSGWSCTLSSNGDVLCVGEQYNNEGGPTSGSGANFGQVRCYRWNGTAWVALGDETHGEVTNDNFGGDIEMNLNGTRYAASATGAVTGYVRVYGYTGLIWQLIDNEIVAQNSGNSFGADISMNGPGNIVAIGEPRDDTNGSDSGRVHIYINASNTWQLRGTPINGEGAGYRSGTSVSINNNGSTVAIGAINDDSSPGQDGAVRIYDFDGTSWIQRGSAIYGGTDTNAFGSDVSINNNGNVVAIGDPGSNAGGGGSSSGLTQVYEFNGTDWVQRGQSLFGVNTSDNFGTSVSLDGDGNTLLVGGDGSSFSDPGYVKFYEYDGTTWVQVGATIVAENTGQTQSQYFGHATAISNDGLTGAVGDYYNQNDGDTFPIPKGSTRAYRRDPSATQDPVAICQDITVFLDINGMATIVPADIDNGSSDAEGPVTLSIDLNTFTCANLGANTVTLTVTDNESNTATCQSTVTVIDNIPPTINCPANQNGTTDANCEFILQDYTGLGVTSDNCRNVTTTQDPLPGTAIGTGITTITLTADDGSNSFTCVFEILIEDTTNPIANCIAPFTLDLDASGMATITVADIDNGSSDACGITSQVDITDFSCADIGDNTVTLTVTDSNGNSSICTTIVTIEDPLNSCNLPPVANCQDVIVSEDSNCQGNATASDFDNGSFDPEGQPVTITVSPVGPYSLGVTTVTLFVDDGVSTSSCTATITVNDATPPTITCPLNITESADNNCGFILPDYTSMATAMDNCSPIMVTQSPPPGTTIMAGMNTITLTASDGNSTADCTFIVDVIDDTPPAVICNDITVQLDNTGSVTITAADVSSASSDNCSVASVTIDNDTFNCSNIGLNNILITITDTSGNISTCNAIVTVEDNIGPSAICQNITVFLDATGMATITPLDINNGSTDNCEIDNYAIDITTFDCTNIGDNTVTLFVSDINGNTSSCTSTVTVIDDFAPMITCPNTITESADGNCTLILPDYTSMATVMDNCSFISVTQSPVPGTAVIIGVNMITLTASDGNSTADCTFIVDVIDNTPPAVICNDFTVQLDSTGNATITAADVASGSTDNCTIDTILLDNDTFDCSNVGSNNVTVTVTDTSGNTSTCTSIVTVEDMVIPSALCQNITVSLDSTGSVTILPQDIDNGSSDNCAIDTYALDIDTFDCSNLGENTVILTVTDVNGNSSTCNAMVTVEETEIPTAVCQNITVALDATGVASITAAELDGGSTDNCGNITTTIDIDTFTCDNLGTNEVTLIVEDINGNVNTCIAIVTIVDETAPTAACLNITVELDGNGMAVIEASDIDNGSTDTCGITNIDIDTFFFDCSNLGENIVTLTVTDDSGNQSSCESTVTVIGTSAVQAICQNITVPLGQDGTMTINPINVYGGNLDVSCPETVFSLDRDTFTCNDIGQQITITLTATDNNGNTTSCLAQVNVVDSLAPIVTCPENQTVISTGPYELPDYFAIGEATAVDNCTTPITIFDQDPSPGTLLEQGTYTITLMAEDSYGFEGDCEFILVVDDVLGTSEILKEISSIGLYPNPADNLVSLNNPSKIQVNLITIYDIIGRLIITENIKNGTFEKTIDISTLQSGNYLVMLQTEIGKFTIQLIKE